MKSIEMYEQGYYAVAEVINEEDREYAIQYYQIAGMADGTDKDITEDVFKAAQEKQIDDGWFHMEDGKIIAASYEIECDVCELYEAVYSY